MLVVTMIIWNLDFTGQKIMSKTCQMNINFGVKSLYLSTRNTTKFGGFFLSWNVKKQAKNYHFDKNFKINSKAI
jgi:hypothetical protein